MATKSRLGKGLGALFPALPGEEDPAELAKAPDEAVKPKSKTATTPSQPKKGAAVKKTGGKRAAMPALDDIAHPSDLFFGSDDKPTTRAATKSSNNVSREHRRTSMRLRIRPTNKRLQRN